LVDDSQLTPRLKALRARELARGLDPELLRRFVLYVRRYRYPVSFKLRAPAAAGVGMSDLTHVEDVQLAGCYMTFCFPTGAAIRTGANRTACVKWAGVVILLCA
jgi:hypothetical protein